MDSSEVECDEVEAVATVLGDKVVELGEDEELVE